MTKVFKELAEGRWCVGSLDYCTLGRYKLCRQEGEGHKSATKVEGRLVFVIRQLQTQLLYLSPDGLS